MWCATTYFFGPPLAGVDDATGVEEIAGVGDGVDFRVEMGGGITVGGATCRVLKSCACSW